MNSNQIENVDMEQMPVKKQATISREQFSEFCSFVNIIKPHFEDFCLVDGKFRMRSDDRTCIVKTRFDYLKGVDFYIAGTKLFAQMLSTLSKKNIITLEIEKDDVAFTDGYQNMQLRKIPSQYLNDVFIPDEAMEEFLNENMNLDNLFLKETLAKQLVCNIKKMSKELKTQIVRIKPVEGNPNRGCMYMTNKSAISNLNAVDAREYSVMLQNSLLIPLQENQYFQVASIPFIFDKDDMKLSYYLNERNILMTIYETSIVRLVVRIYGRAALREED